MLINPYQEVLFYPITLFLLNTRFKEHVRHPHIDEQKPPTEK